MRVPQVGNRIDVSCSGDIGGNGIGSIVKYAYAINWFVCCEHVSYRNDRMDVLCGVRYLRVHQFIASMCLLYQIVLDMQTNTPAWFVYMELAKRGCTLYQISIYFGFGGLEFYGFHHGLNKKQHILNLTLNRKGVAEIVFVMWHAKTCISLRFYI